MNLFLLATIAFIPLLVNGKERPLATEIMIGEESKGREIPNGYTKLMLAIKRGTSFETIQKYIASGANVNAVSIEFLRYYNPALRYVLDRGIDPESVSIIKALLAAGANANQCTYNRVKEQSIYGFMPLISYAVIYSSPKVVQLFIEHGADVNQKLDKGLGSNKTALRYAEELGKKESAPLLKKAGAVQN